MSGGSYGGGTDKGPLGAAEWEVAMTFREVVVNEAFDERRFESEPGGIWKPG